MDAGKPRRLDQLGVKHYRKSISTRRNNLVTMNFRISRRDIHPALMPQLRQKSDSHEERGRCVHPD
jgi:hypothetical protein